MTSDVILYARHLSKPFLRFDYAIPTSKAQSARSGMLKYGPYDKNLFPGNIRAVAVYPAQYRSQTQVFLRYLTDGVDDGYPGFKREFRTEIRFTEFEVGGNTQRQYDDAFHRVLRENPDLVLVVLERRVGSADLYGHTKTVLLGNGIPCQIVNTDKLMSSTTQLRWIVENVALAIYAKVGGTPWVIEAPTSIPEIVVGMSRALDRTKKVIVGFTTLFKHNGDFILSHFKSPVTSWEDYERGLESLVCEAIEEYSKRERQPQSLVFHFHKATGHREIEAVERALRSLRAGMEYALLHVNSYSNYRLFDTSDATFVPPTGLMVSLGFRNSLLLSDGRTEAYERPFVGTPTVLQVVMDKNSQMGFDEFPRLVEQVYHFAFVNWRGFSARTIPVTINYSQLIARLVAGLESIDAWNRIIANGLLTDKAWFL